MLLVRVKNILKVQKGVPICIFFVKNLNFLVHRSSLFKKQKFKKFVADQNKVELSFGDRIDPNLKDIQEYIKKTMRQQ